jgi:hypothetical protein
VYRKIELAAANTQETRRLAVFGLGMAEIIILAVIGGMICMPVLIGVVVVVILSTKDRRRE